MGAPAVYVVALSVLTIARFAWGAGVSVSVKEHVGATKLPPLPTQLVPGLVVPGGGVTEAVLTRLPVVLGATVPVTMKVTELPAPAAMLTVAAKLLPDPEAPLVTEALPVVLEVQAAPVMVAGI